VSQQLALLPGYLTAHLQLALVALLLGTAVSVPLGVWVTRHPRAERVVLGIASVIQTIPSLALLAVMVPALAALGVLTAAAFGVELASIGYPPAIIGLTLYSVLPMLRNTVAGVAGVDRALVEAACGVGMTPGQRLRLVELPLALPVIVAGVRTAAVWVVGMATLSTPVGATSLGNYIFSGLQTRNLTAVLVGCVAAALLALVLDTLIHVLEVGAREHRRPLLVSALALLLALYAYTGASFAAAWFEHGPTPVTIGAKTFTEQYVLGELLGRQVTRVTGRPTRIVSSLGSTVAFDALASGALDVYVDYSGTIWATVMGRATVPDDPRTVLDEVSRYLDRTRGIRTVGALGFENAYALAMRGVDAHERGVSSISALAPYAPSLVIAGDYEFFQRPEWRAVRARYGLAFREQRSMDPSLMYQAVADGQVDVISAFSTDGRIAALDLAVLDDDRRAIPPYDAIILASARLVREAPPVLQALTALVGTIDAPTMRRMNAAVDEHGESPAAVAEAFLDRLAEPPPE
jgi:osmoprotectant transport system substrate-binding protein/osmoprotectant transport system permease protein